MLKIYLLVVKSSHDGATGRLIAPKEGSQGEGGVGNEKRECVWWVRGLETVSDHLIIISTTMVLYTTICTWKVDILNQYTLVVVI